MQIVYDGKSESKLLPLRCVRATSFDQFVRVSEFGMNCMYAEATRDRVKYHGIKGLLLFCENTAWFK